MSERPAGSVLALAALLGAFASIGALPANRAWAVDLNKSRLTSIDVKSCRKVSRHKDGGAWMCPGLRGWPVYFAEGDLRHMLAFGPSPQKRRSATQSLAPFNTIFDGKGRATVEWRVEGDDRGRIIPFATIVRFHTSMDGAKGEVLVVTKVDARDSCQLASIDANANPDAMAIARAWAIAEAKNRPCPDAPITLGKVGKLPL